MMTIGIDSVRPGMVLARSIVNESGVTLFGKGTEVTDSVIQRIKNSGTAMVTIEGRRTPKVPLGEELRLLDERFASLREAPHMKEISQIVRRYIESLYT